MLQILPLNVHSQEQLRQALAEKSSTILQSREAKEDRGRFSFLDDRCLPHIKIFSIGQRGLQIARDIESLLIAGGDSDASYFHATLSSESSSTVNKHGTAAFSVGGDALATLFRFTDLVLLVGDIDDADSVDAALRIVRAARITDLLTLAFLVGSEMAIHPAHNSNLPTVLNEVGTWVYLSSNNPHALRTLLIGIQAILAVAYQPGVICVDLSDLYWLFKRAGHGQLLVLDDLSAADAPFTFQRALSSLCPEPQTGQWPHKLFVEVRVGTQVTVTEYFAINNTCSQLIGDRDDITIVFSMPVEPRDDSRLRITVLAADCH